MPEHGRGLSADEVGQLGEVVGGERHGRSARGTAGRGADERTQQRRNSRLAGREVESHQDMERLRPTDGPIEEAQCLVGGQRGRGTPDPALGGGVEMAGHAAGLVPQAPGQRDGGAALGPPAGDEGVHLGVGGGIGGLPGTAEHPGGGGEHDERLDIPRQLVECQRGFDLGRAQSVEPVGGQRGEHAVVQDARRVDHGGDGVLGEDRRERVPVGGVHGDDRGPGTPCVQIGDEVGRAGGVGTPAAEEQELADAVGVGEVASQQPAEGSGTAGDQNAAVGSEGDGGVEGGGPPQTRCRPEALADHDLWFSGPACDVVGVRVDQDEAPGMLGLCGAHQAPHTRARRVGGVRSGSEMGTDDQRLVRVGGQPGLEGNEHLCGRPPGGVEDVDIGCGDRFDRDPVENEVRVGRGRRSRRQRAQGQAGQSADRTSLGVGEVDRHTVVGRGDPDAQSGGAGRGDGRPGEGEGKQRRTLPRDHTADPDGLEGGVEQRGVQDETVGGEVLGQRHLGEDLVVLPPHAGQALEGRPVVEPGGGQGAVVDRDLVGLIRRPRGQLGGRGHDVAECAGGMACPRGVGGGVGRAGVHGENTGARGDLQVDGAVGRDHERGVQGQLGDTCGPGVLGGGEREIEQSGAGDQHLPGDDVVGQPRVAGQPESAGEQGTTVGDGGGGGQDRVVEAPQTRGGDISGSSPGGEPEALASERVGGQLDAFAVGNHPPPVRRHAVHDGLPQGEQHPLQPTLVAPERTHRDHIVGQGHRQHRMRRTLHERAEPLRSQRGDSVGEPDGGAEVVEPIPGIHPRAVLNLTRQSRMDRDLTRTRPDRLQHRQQLVPQLIDLRRMRGIVHRDPLRPHTLGVAGSDQLVQGLRLTRHHHRCLAIDRSDRHPLTEPGNAVTNLDLTQRDRHHPATTRQPGQHPRPQRHHPSTVLQRQRPRHHRSRDLTLRMPHHSVRLDPPRPPQLGQRHHHSPQHRLHHINPTQQVGIVQHIGQRPVHERLQRRRTLRQPPREHRRLRSQPPRHPHPLRTLTRKHEHRPARITGRALHQQRVRRPVGQRPHGVHTQRDGPLLEQRAARGQRPCRPRGGQRGQHPGKLGRVGPQRLWRAGRQDERHDGRVRDRFGLGIALLQDDVGVGTADAERRHRRPARPVGLRPRLGFGQQLDRARGPVHTGGGPVDVQGLGQGAVVEREDRLDDPRDARGGLGVADVRLHRAQEQRPLPVLAVGGEQGLRLDRVTERRAGAVRLDHVHIGRIKAGVGQGLTDHPLLRRTVGCGQAVGRAVLVDRRATHQRQYPMPMAARVGQLLHDEHAHALAPAGAVGTLGEGLAPAVRGQTPLPRELDERRRRRHDRHTAGQGQ